MRRFKDNAFGTSERESLTISLLIDAYDEKFILVAQSRMSDNKRPSKIYLSAEEARDAAETMLILAGEITDKAES